MIKNYLNYAGSKDRYYPLIREFMVKALGRKKKGKFLIDLFCGSGVVAFNSMDLFSNVVAIDVCRELINIHTWIQYTPIENLLSDIAGVIRTYNLSKTNKEGFLKLREDYNRMYASRGLRDPLRLFCLVMHSFNYSLHLNSKGEFNCPAGTGRSYFNESLKQKLIAYKEYLTEASKTSSITFQTYDGLNFSWDKVRSEDLKDVVVFADPPYSAAISKHPYRVGSVKWTEDEDRKLLEVLDRVNELGGKFIFTNVFSNNGMTNLPLIKWAENYNTHRVGVDYSNCNYQRSNKGDTDEVIIYNF